MNRLQRFCGARRWPASKSDTSEKLLNLSLKKQKNKLRLWGVGFLETYNELTNLTSLQGRDMKIVQ
jgi:hypothetical protein